MRLLVMAVAGAALLAAGSTASAAPAAPASVLVRIPNESTVSSWGGVTALSVLADGGSAYRLAIVRGRRLRLLPVPASPVPFDVDVGPDSTGAPALVYARCAEADPQRCRIVINWLDRRGEVAVRTTDGAGDERVPALWRGRIAWYSDGRVLTRSRLASQGIAPDVLVRDEPADLELRTPRFAALLAGSEGEFGSTEVRAGRLGARARRLMLLSSGIGGQEILGLSLTRRHVAWYVSCFGDTSGCAERGGAYRRRPGDDVSQRARGMGQLAGWALVGGRTALGLDGGTSLGEIPGELRDNGIDLDEICAGARGGGRTAGCPLVRFGALRWRTPPVSDRP